MNTAAYHPFRSQAAKNDYLAMYDQAAAQWTVPYEETMIETPYGQTFVRISGKADAAPLVLLPGAGTSSLMWTLHIKALSENYRTYAVDSLINTGNVGRSIYTRLIKDANEAMQWLDALFTGLNLADKINLLAPSYGGWLASHYALHCPDRLDKVVLLAPAGTILPFSAAYLMRMILLNVLPFRFNYRNFFKWSFPDLAKKDPDFLEAMIDDFLLSARCFVLPNPKESPRLTAMSDDELQAITVPTLVLIGENEKLYVAQKAIERLCSVAPQIQAEIIPDAGHDLLLVQMELLHQKILAFLA